MRWEVILVGASWAELSGDTLSHPPPTLGWGSPGSTWQPSCLYQGIQLGIQLGWEQLPLKAGRTVGLTWVTLLSSWSTTRGVALPLALSVLSLTYFLASLCWVVCYLQEDGSKLMCWFSLYSFSRIFLMMETVKSWIHPGSVFWSFKASFLASHIIL